MITEESFKHPVIIFKHSTRCSISAVVLSRWERSWKDGEYKPYFLDLLAHRDVSNAIAGQFGVQHESPQVLVISKGLCIYNESHMGINVADVVSASKAA